MTKEETKNFIKKIKAYYQMFRLEEDSLNEWATRLKPYDYQDVLNKFEEHLKGEYADEPPKLHFITRYLKTIEQKQRISKDHLIRCNLCGKEMYLSIYDNGHYDKCLMITTLITILRKEGKDIKYDELDAYSIDRLDKVLSKYVPIRNDIKDVKELL